MLDEFYPQIANQTVCKRININVILENQEHVNIYIYMLSTAQLQ